MKEISNITTGLERAFYGSTDTTFTNIKISGIEDGESAFKECSNINVTTSEFYLRYPFWHDNKLSLSRSLMYNTCRAPFWYSKDITIDNVISSGVKAFRECNNITMTNSSFDSEEIFWNCHKIDISNCKIKGFYAFFQCSDIVLTQLDFSGKYSFQYVKNLQIKDSILNTKDAFWHAKDVVVTNTLISGEYLGWYSENLTLIKCHIKGTQPLCYCKNLRLVDCTFDADADLAFEYSEVNGNILNEVTSIKNPLKGQLEVLDVKELIVDEYDRSKGQMTIKCQKRNN